MTLVSLQTKRRLARALVVATGVSGFGQAQASSTLSRPLRALADNATAFKAAAGDVGSISAIVAAFAASISAPGGGAIDRGRLESLFVPGGRIAIGIDPAHGKAADVAFVTPGDYADLFQRAGDAKTGFFDEIIANRVERFGIMAHVYSSYASRHDPHDVRPFRRGVKSFELLNSGGRWYIVQVFYDFERSGTLIPPTLLIPKSD